jgi:RNA polymerase sigma-70 factor (ECF subfamily)
MTDPSEKAIFTENVEACMGGLYRLANRLTGNPADAEDLVASAVIKAWEGFGTLVDRQRFRAWIFRILHNCFISAYRKEQAYADLAADNGQDDLSALLNAQTDEFLLWWANPERKVINDMLTEDIMRAVASLPEAFRMTVYLVSTEGLSYDEAAEALGVPPGTVRSRMKRGRTLLQKALWQQARDAGLINEPTESV